MAAGGSSKGVYHGCPSETLNLLTARNMAKVSYTNTLHGLYDAGRERLLPVKNKIRALYHDTLLQNSLYLMLTTGTMAVLGFGFWLIVAHLYPPDQVGVASTLVASMNFIAYLSLLGFNSTFIRFLPKSKNRDEHLDTGLVLVALAAIVVSGL